MLENLNIKKRVWSCAIRTLLDSLSEADQQILRDNLVDPNISHNALAKALNEIGLVKNMADTTVRRHRVEAVSALAREFEPKPS
jgi:hypothetical protein